MVAQGQVHLFVIGKIVARMAEVNASFLERRCDFNVRTAINHCAAFDAPWIGLDGRPPLSRTNCVEEHMER